MEVKEIKRRLLNILPTNFLHINEFLNIVKIEIDDKKIESACISCDSYPTLTFNSKFVATYCKSDEHLFMLLMHEMYHIILGHTKLFKLVTVFDNIAFDAVINSILCKEFPDKAYSSFFENINPSDSFPGCILRTKAENTPLESLPILDELYNKTTGTYYEVYQFILSHLQDCKNPFLLGNHNNNVNTNNPILDKLFKKVTKDWPQVIKINCIDKGSFESEEVTKLNKFKSNKIFLSLVKKALTNSDKQKVGLNPRFEKTQTQEYSFMMNYKDRTYFAKDMLLSDYLMFNNTSSQLTLTKDNYQQTLLYFDVSGSMDSELPKYLPLLISVMKRKLVKAFAFSTSVNEIKIDDIKKGQYISTGGTDVNSIFKHFFSLKNYKKYKKIAIFTDGFVGELSSSFLDKIKEIKLKVYVGLLGSLIDDENFKNFAQEIRRIR